MSDDIFNYVRPQTETEIQALNELQQADIDKAEAKMATKIALLKKLGLTADEAAALLG